MQIDTSGGGGLWNSAGAAAAAAPSAIATISGASGSGSMMPPLFNLSGGTTTSSQLLLSGQGARASTGRRHSGSRHRHLRSTQLNNIHNNANAAAAASSSSSSLSYHVNYLDSSDELHKILVSNMFSSNIINKSPRSNSHNNNNSNIQPLTPPITYDSTVLYYSHDDAEAAFARVRSSTYPPLCVHIIVLTLAIMWCALTVSALDDDSPLLVSYCILGVVVALVAALPMLCSYIARRPPAAAQYRSSPWMFMYAVWLLVDAALVSTHINDTQRQAQHRVLTVLHVSAAATLHGRFVELLPVLPLFLMYCVGVGVEVALRDGSWSTLVVCLGVAVIVVMLLVSSFLRERSFRIRALDKAYATATSSSASSAAGGLTAALNAGEGSASDGCLSSMLYQPLNALASEAHSLVTLTQLANRQRVHVAVITVLAEHMKYLTETSSAAIDSNNISHRSNSNLKDMNFDMFIEDLVRDVALVYRRTSGITLLLPIALKGECDVRCDYRKLRFALFALFTEVAKLTNEMKIDVRFVKVSEDGVVDVAIWVDLSERCPLLSFLETPSVQEPSNPLTMASNNNNINGATIVPMQPSSSTPGVVPIFMDGASWLQQHLQSMGTSGGSTSTSVTNNNVVGPSSWPAILTLNLVRNVLRAFDGDLVRIDTNDTSRLCVTMKLARQPLQGAPNIGGGAGIMVVSPRAGTGAGVGAGASHRAAGCGCPLHYVAPSKQSLLEERLMHPAPNVPLHHPHNEQQLRAEDLATGGANDTDSLVSDEASALPVMHPDHVQSYNNNNNDNNNHNNNTMDPFGGGVRLRVVFFTRDVALYQMLAHHASIWGREYHDDDRHYYPHRHHHDHSAVSCIIDTQHSCRRDDLRTLISDVGGNAQHTPHAAGLRHDTNFRYLIVVDEDMTKSCHFDEPPPSSLVVYLRKEGLEPEPVDDFCYALKPVMPSTWLYIIRMALEGLLGSQRRDLIAGRRPPDDRVLRRPRSLEQRLQQMHQESSSTSISYAPHTSTTTTVAANTCTWDAYTDADSVQSDTHLSNVSLALEHLNIPDTSLRTYMHSRGTFRVLIVSGDATNRDLQATTLLGLKSFCKLRVDVEKTFTEGIHKFHEGHALKRCYKLVIVDAAQDIVADRFVNACRNHEEYLHLSDRCVPVVVIEETSALDGGGRKKKKADIINTDTAVADSAVFYVPKPMRPVDLLEQVILSSRDQYNRWLMRRDARRRTGSLGGSGVSAESEYSSDGSTMPTQRERGDSHSTQNSSSWVLATTTSAAGSVLMHASSSLTEDAESTPVNIPGQAD
eukprot:PhM_4_TR15499/c0_g1_i1/m.32723